MYPQRMNECTTLKIITSDLETKYDNTEYQQNTNRKYRNRESFSTQTS